MTRTERSHLLRADSLTTLCGAAARRFPFPQIAENGQEPTCGTCLRLAAEGARCETCGYRLVKCSCPQPGWAAFGRELARPCPQCEAPAGARCRKPNGYLYEKSHQARSAPAGSPA